MSRQDHLSVFVSFEPSTQAEGIGDVAFAVGTDH